MHVKSDPELTKHAPASGRITTVKREKGNWVEYRARFGLTRDDEIGLHFGSRRSGPGEWARPYQEIMSDCHDLVLRSLQKAQENGRRYIMFLHGQSTSRPGQTTARSVVRGLMRSKEATPYIVRSECIQHDTVFVAKIKAATSKTAE